MRVEANLKNGLFIGLMNLDVIISFELGTNHKHIKMVVLVCITTTKNKSNQLLLLTNQCKQQI